MNAATDIPYLVVVNHEEQYSIWPASRPLPAGWKGVSQPASRDECLSLIETLWTDMRPLSVRTHLENHNLSTKTEENHVPGKN
jgi:MbtH protein